MVKSEGILTARVKQKGSWMVPPNLTAAYNPPGMDICPEYPRMKDFPTIVAQYSKRYSTTLPLNHKVDTVTGQGNPHSAPRHVWVQETRAWCLSTSQRIRLRGKDSKVC
jgi:hypothetical protein